ncbi:MAG: DUF2628 domain-containing protein [Acetobacteraceae bacterium]|nr:DUF2628 domain-containing protein [Acetobacteraceae bacterium]
MRAWTVHLPPGAPQAAGAVPATAAPAAGTPPLLLREGFSWAALVFGPLWLLRHRCWLAGLGTLAVILGGGALMGAPWTLGAHLLLGFHGQDLRRWTLARRGWRLAHVVVGADEDSALARLLLNQRHLVPAFSAGIRT